MHKRLLNEAIIELTLAPNGPILIKAGEGASDPTRPDMSFVRTVHRGRETVYLPGSSLKGVLRAHCERLARTVDSDQRRERHKKPLSCNPALQAQEADTDYRRRNYQCSKALSDVSPDEAHSRSCFLCRLFGNTSLASHFRTADAYPVGEPPRLEERNGVAIDRVFGSVAVGPFNYETVTAGQFRTTLQVRNFTLAQLGLLALTLRDLEAGRVRLGFGKSRGLGVVEAQVNRLALRYPPCTLEEGLVKRLGGSALDRSKLYGVGAFLSEQDAAHYDYPRPDQVDLPEGYAYAADEWLGVEVNPSMGEGGSVDWQLLGRACVPKWAEAVGHAE